MVRCQVTAAPDTRVQPYPPGTPCRYRGQVVRAYFRTFVWTMDETYDVKPFGSRETLARGVGRAELEVCRG